MTEIKDLDIVSERGKRTVENGLKTENGRKILNAFQFGEIKNVLSEIERQGRILYIKGEKAEKAVIITLKLDSETYTAEKLRKIYI